MTDQVLVRAFPTTLERTGPRTITGRLVPYNSPTQVMDILGNGDRDIYREGFRSGVFSRQSGSAEPGVARRIRLVHQHNGGLGYLGPFTALREEPDGLYGTAEVLRSKANDVEDLIAAGIRGLSVEFWEVGRGGTELVDGVRWRTRAHLDAVALEPKGAYTESEVLAFREEVDEEKAEEQAERDQELAAAEAKRAAAEQEEQARARVEEARVAAERDAVDRRARWDALTARLDTERSRQTLYVREYGLMVPPHDGLPIKAY